MSFLTLWSIFVLHFSERSTGLHRNAIWFLQNAKCLLCSFPAQPPSLFNSRTWQCPSPFCVLRLLSPSNGAGLFQWWLILNQSISIEVFSSSCQNRRTHDRSSFWPRGGGGAAAVILGWCVEIFENRTKRYANFQIDFFFQTGEGRRGNDGVLFKSDYLHTTWAGRLWFSKQMCDRESQSAKPVFTFGRL